MVVNFHAQATNYIGMASQAQTLSTAQYTMSACINVHINFVCVHMHACAQVFFMYYSSIYAYRIPWTLLRGNSYQFQVT